MTSNTSSDAASDLEKIAFGLSLAELNSADHSFPTFAPFTPFTPHNTSETNGTSYDEHVISVEPTTEPSTANKVHLAPVLSLSAFALLVVASVVWKYVAKLRRRNGRKREVGLDEDLLYVGMETRASRYRGVWFASSDEERQNVLPESTTRHDSSGYKKSLRDADLKAYLTVDRTPSLMSDLQNAGSCECLAFVSPSSSESNLGFVVFPSDSDRKMRNVEIKATLRDAEDLSTRAAALAGIPATVIKQKDTFFNATKGRLKLRVETIDGVTKSSLIFYDRPDTAEAKLSEYDISPVSDPDSLRSVLGKTYGVKGEVEKSRRLFLVDQTRVHVDSVLNLGDYVELEVVLRDDQTLQEGEAIAKDLMGKLGIRDEDLLTGAYMDMLVG